VKTIRLEEMTYEDVANVRTRPNVVAIPLGSTEQHGPHLPLDTDTRIAEAFCEEAARRIADDVVALVTPAIPFGISEHHMRFPGTLSIDGETFVSLVSQIGRSLIRHGFDRFVLVNGHGGNQGALQLVAQKLRLDLGARYVFYFPEWSLAAEAFARIRESPPGGTSHACEYETSVYLHLAPERVRMDRAVKEMPPPLITGGVSDLFVPGPYSWPPAHDTTISGVEGDPTLATVAKGRELFESAVENLARLFREVAYLERVHAD
jgi:creatinine amidohydrolase